MWCCRQRFLGLSNDVWVIHGTKLDGDLTSIPERPSGFKVVCALAAFGCSSPESVIAGVIAGIVQVSPEKWFGHRSESADECDASFESDEYPEDESFPFSSQCQRLCLFFGYSYKCYRMFCWQQHPRSRPAPFLLDKKTISSSCQLEVPIYMK